MKKEHLFSVGKKDFKIQTFKSGGKGGQHQNKTDSGVRIIHSDSGAIGISRSDKSQYRNKKLALQRLTNHPKFKLWIIRKSLEVIEGITLEQKVNDSMQSHNLKTEVKDPQGKWINYNDHSKSM